jgi:hypothetical protein
MKKSITSVFLTALAMLLLTATAFAQKEMTSEKKMMMREMSPDSSRVMMMRMSKNHMTMNQGLMKMQEHMKSMMKMEDMTALRAEMQKQMEMMQSMQKTMGEQDRMYHMMMGPEGMGHMQGMEGMHEKTTEKPMEESKPESVEKEKKY